MEHQEGLREWIEEGGQKVDGLVRILRPAGSDLLRQIIDEVERCKKKAQLPSLTDSKKFKASSTRDDHDQGLRKLDPHWRQR